MGRQGAEALSDQRVLSRRAVRYPLYDVVAERGLPVLFHRGHPVVARSQVRPSDVVDSAAADYPEVNFVLGHSARWETWSDEAFASRIFKTNVYLDMSLWQHWASPDEICKKVLWLRDRVGIDRVLFGSDMAGIEVSWTLKEWVDQVRLFPELANNMGAASTKVSSTCCWGSTRCGSTDSTPRTSRPHPTMVARPEPDRGRQAGGT